MHSIGFTSILRISAPTRCIVETHPDSLIDLRLLDPWEELSALVTERTANLDLPESEGGMDDHAHGHVPFALLILKYLSDWKAAHDGKHPASYKEKNELKDLIRNHMRTNVGGSEENYDEANTQHQISEQHCARRRIFDAKTSSVLFQLPFFQQIAARSFIVILHTNKFLS